MAEELHRLSKGQVDALLVSHSLLFVVTQWLDLLTTGQMPGKNGLNYEGMALAKDWILSNPEGLEIMKILVVPASIVLITAVAHVKLFERAESFSYKDFEYIPFKVLRLLNLFMLVVILINVFAADLSNLAQDNPMYPIIKELLLFYQHAVGGS